MAVFLSPVGGVAAQFFTNTGAVLTGGKLYTYAAGTTTPQATYTTSAGNVARTNPIVLDAAGRVPGSGEIWLTESVYYKFLLKDSNDVLIATYDNISAFATIPVSSNNVTYLPAGAGAVLTTVQAKLRDIVSVKDFGAVGNGVTNDTVAIQAAFNYGLANNKAVYVPSGTYAISSTLTIGTGAVIYGDGTVPSVITGVPFSMTTPLITNVDPNFIGFLNVKGLTLTGGSDGIKFTVASETAFLYFTDLLITGQTGDNFYTNKLLQLATFTNCNFRGGNRGVVCDAFTANLNNFINCRFGNHIFEDVKFVNSEVNNFIGCSFENAGVLGNNASIIVAFAPNNLNFYGCYFENGHERLLAETASKNNTKFTNCHFTYDGNNDGFKFGADGIINFDNCSAFVPIIAETAATKFVYTGTQYQHVSTAMAAISAAGVHNVASKNKTYPVSGSINLMNIDGSGCSDGQLVGKLTLQYQSLETGGFNYRNLYKEVRLSVGRFGGGSLLLNSNDTISFYTSDGTITVAITQNVGASTSTNIVIQATFTGITTPTNGSLLTWGFESTGGSSGGAYIVPSCID